MPDISVVVKQDNLNVSVDTATPVNVSVGGIDVNVSLGQVLPVYQQKETHKQISVTATEGQTVFSLSAIPRDKSVQTFKNGVLLGADEYSIVGSTLTVNAGFDASDILDVHFIVA